MPHSGWYWLIGLMVVGFPGLLALKGRGRDVVTISGLGNILYACAYILLFPSGDKSTTAIAALALIGFNLALRFASTSMERRVLALARWRPVLIVTAVLTTGLVPLGLLEASCEILTELHVLKFHHGIETVWRTGHDDWRLATITGDQNREPDPILLWRPAAHKPFNSQRFKGHLAEIPKRSDVVRIMCYGDSLTDGPPKGGWPSWLQTLLEDQPPIPGRRFEVINAGVAGYSSHQGLMRFLQEVDQYCPDMLLVSFGWNDAAEAVGRPDKTFQIPPWPVVMLQRALVRYRTYLVLMYYSRGWRAQPPVVKFGPPHPRVSVKDYLTNLERFRAEAQDRGIPVAFLTRPHKLPPEALSHDTTWRGTVPRYNEALHAWSRQRHVPLIDARQFFQELPGAHFTDECHLTTKGYRYLAEIVRDQLVSNPGGSPALAWSGGPNRKLSRVPDNRNQRVSLLEVAPLKR